MLKDLNELVKAEVITEATAEKIRDYYRRKPDPSSNRLFIVFGVLGALLVGMGIILILAHNWDIIPKAAKLSIGLLPLIAGQALTGYLILKKSDNKVWKEGTAVFLFLAVAVSISIVSQVYNLEGSLARFLLVWMVLSLPIVYVLRSSVASMLFICGITWYACEAGYFTYRHTDASMYWVLLVLILPFYYIQFFKHNNKGNYFYFHSWLLALSVTACLGIVATESSVSEFIMVPYMCLFSSFVIMGEMKIFDTGRVISNAYLVVGSLGVIVSLLFLSFDIYWEEIGTFPLDILLTSKVMIAGALLMLTAGALLVLLSKERKLSEINSKSFAFVIFPVLLFVGVFAPGIAQLLINLVILLLAIHTIRSGAQKDHLGILNYGLLIISALILCRFFDTDFSFIVRGLLFIGVGVGFFAANYYLIRKRKQQS